jgi:hypothetical protein
MVSLFTHRNHSYRNDLHRRRITDDRTNRCRRLSPHIASRVHPLSPLPGNTSNHRHRGRWSNRHSACHAGLPSQTRLPSTGCPRGQCIAHIQARHRSRSSLLALHSAASHKRHSTCQHLRPQPRPPATVHTYLPSHHPLCQKMRPGSIPRPKRTRYVLPAEHLKGIGKQAGDEHRHRRTALKPGRRHIHPHIEHLSHPVLE